jgi:ParB family chromosome partitioning protein
VTARRFALVSSFAFTVACRPLRISSRSPLEVLRVMMSTTPVTGELLHLNVHQIEPNPHNPRQIYDEAALDALAASIQHWGQLQPVLVRRAEGAYQLVCGERRWLAHQRAGLEYVWARVIEADEEDLLPLALIENLQRVGLSHPEKIAALDQLAELTRARGLRRTAEHLGVDPSWLSRQLALQRDPVIFPSLESGRVSFGQAAELLRAPEMERVNLLERVVTSDGRVTTAMIRDWVEEARRRPQPLPRPATASTSARGDADATPVDLPPSPFLTLIAQLDALSAPATAADRAVLRELIARARALLAKARSLTPLSQQDRRTFVEMTCLNCGHLAGRVEEGTRFLVSQPGSASQRGRSWVCGRCSGTLIAGERGVHYGY